MEMKLSICSLRQDIDVSGGMTQTVFPRVEKWLKRTVKNQNTIKRLAIRKKIGRYESLIDFLFCEIFTSFRQSCFEYYEGRGNKLNDIISDKEARYYDDFLIFVLLYATRERGTFNSWSEFRRKVLLLKP